MSVDLIKNQLGDFAKDIRLNVGSVLTEEGAPGLTRRQIQLVALSVAFSLKHSGLIEAVRATFSDLTQEDVNAAKSAATIMAMNNIYYRFVHMTGDAEYKKLPARLRMNVIANPGVNKDDFELMSLAVSAINGCEMCVQSHVGQLTKAGFSKEGIQSSARIAATLNATVQALFL